MLHLTMNTGHAADYPLPDITEEVSSLIPLILQRGGPIPTRTGYSVKITLDHGNAAFTVYHKDEKPVTLNVLCLRRETRETCWKSIAQVARQIDIGRRLLEPPDGPRWLATLVLPHAFYIPQEDMTWIGAFERVLARAVIGHLSHG